MCFVLDTASAVLIFAFRECILGRPGFRYLKLWVGNHLEIQKKEKDENALLDMSSTHYLKVKYEVVRIVGAKCHLSLQKINDGYLLGHICYR